MKKSGIDYSVGHVFASKSVHIFCHVDFVHVHFSDLFCEPNCIKFAVHQQCGSRSFFVADIAPKP